VRTLDRCELLNQLLIDKFGGSQAASRPFCNLFELAGAIPVGGTEFERNGTSSIELLQQHAQQRRSENFESTGPVHFIEALKTFPKFDFE